MKIPGYRLSPYRPTLVFRRTVRVTAKGDVVNQDAHRSLAQPMLTRPPIVPLFAKERQWQRDDAF